MTATQAAAKLAKQFPQIEGIKNAGEWGGEARYKDAIHLGNAAEGGMVNGSPAAMGSDHGYGIFGVATSLYDALTKLGFFAEWYDGGTLLAWRV